MTRLELLDELRAKFTDGIWELGRELEKTLAGLHQVSHFDLMDPAAVGAAIHSALPSAALAASLERFGLGAETFDVGPAKKVEGRIDIGGIERHVSLELHYAGPQGGTRKGRHQHAHVEGEAAPAFPGFELDAPQKVLLFLAYHLAPSKVRIEKMYLSFADGVDRLKTQVPRPEPAILDTPEIAPVPAIKIPSLDPVPVTKGTVVKAKKARNGVEDDAGQKSKRGDGSSSA